MQVVLSSMSESKKRSVISAFEKCFVDEEIKLKAIGVNSNVSQRPINEEILIGTKNRNKELYRFCNKSDMDIDFFVSIEGGYEKILDKYYLVTYVVMYDRFQEEYTGKSTGLQISRKMYEYAKKQNSLNEVIEKILAVEENKKNLGISGFLTNGFLKRDEQDEVAVINAIQAYINKDNYLILDKNIIL